MRFYKVISVLFHPILLPIIGTLYYFLITPINLSQELKYKITIIIATGTYVMPLLLLYILKRQNKIKSYELQSIKERKSPLIFMIALFFVLGNSLLKINEIIELASLFIGCSLALTFTYFLFLKNLKTSIHMIGASSMVTFIWLFSYEHQINMLSSIAVFFIFSGLIGQARLHLKAHTTKEVYTGFFIGSISQLIVSGMYVIS